tara:strand:+ start:516 stop:866 length:351 start_codon:yes stop_codon:yes gene_type:complete
MASYSREQLNGKGVPIELIENNVTFTFTSTNTGSSYFTMETVKNTNGFYDSSTPNNAGGTYSSFSQIDENTLITSSYIASVVIPPGNSFFDFDPGDTVEVSSSMLRATGEVSLTIS